MAEKNTQPPVAHTPEVDGGKCVHGLSPSATCRACVDVCPPGAFVLSEDMLGFDETACDGCGLCRPACPEQAISLSFSPLLRVDERDRLIVFAACDKTDWIGKGQGKGGVICVNGITHRDIAGYEKRQLKELIVHKGDCDRCTRGEAINIERFIEDTNRWRKSRYRKSVPLTIVDEPGWRARLKQFPQAAERPNVDRRRLLSAFRGRLSETPDEVPSCSQKDADENDGRERLYYHRPQIDELKCYGCDACIKVCPHDCFRFEQGEGSRASYHIVAEACTGCGLCRDVCDVDAVSLGALGAAGQGLVELHHEKCYKCGTKFHVPVAQEQEKQQCRICRQHDHTSKLFQVYD